MINDKRPSVVTLAILTALTCILWVFFSVISVLSKKPAPAVPPDILESVDPTLDLETLSKIRNGLVFNENETDSIIINDSVDRFDQTSESATLESESTLTPNDVDFGVPSEDLQDE